MATSSASRRHSVWGDALCCFKAGDRVRVLLGEHMGRTGTVDAYSAVYDQNEPGGAIAAYNVTLDGAKGPVILRWGHMARQ